MQVIIFEGELRMGDSVGATMVYAQDFRLSQCAMKKKELLIETDGVQILGGAEQQRVSSHDVYFDHAHVGKIDSDRTLLTLLPEASAGPHRVSIHVSPFPGAGLCDDFVLKRVLFTCE